MRKTAVIAITAAIAVLGLGCNNPVTSEAVNDHFGATGIRYQNMVDQWPTADTAGLTLFFAQMPKGGDIHHHYSGSLYAEYYLDVVAQKGYWINKDTLKVDKAQTPASITVEQLRQNQPLYRDLIMRWSNRDYNNHFYIQPPPDVQFFSAFANFGSISGEEIAQGLQVLKRRALSENVQYLETMLKATEYSKFDVDFDQNCQRLVANPDGLNQLFSRFAEAIRTDAGFQPTITKFTDSVKTYHTGIDDAGFTMRFQCYASRNSSPSIVFSSLYAAFSAARQSELIVGINMVGAENNLVAIRDYRLHMAMFQFFKARFPGVHIALHAGELSLGMVPPEELNFHISEAVNIACAERIGHGVDIAYEKSPLPLLRKMAKDHIAIEINLSSNEFILGVANADHPINIYRQYNVPIVISTDDSGIIRNNLTAEYVLLSSRYRFTYAEIKALVYNSIRYSFLSDADKARNLKILDEKFRQFEFQFAQQPN